MLRYSWSFFSDCTFLRHFWSLGYLSSTSGIEDNTCSNASNIMMSANVNWNGKQALDPLKKAFGVSLEVPKTLLKSVNFNLNRNSICFCLWLKHRPLHANFQICRFFFTIFEIYFFFVHDIESCIPWQLSNKQFKWCQ